MYVTLFLIFYFLSHPKNGSSRKRCDGVNKLYASLGVVHERKETIRDE
jgi:hypothetical protein